jgi:hypothetical protein
VALPRTWAPPRIPAPPARLQRATVAGFPRRGVTSGRWYSGNVDDDAEARVLLILARTVPGVSHAELHRADWLVRQLS